MFTPNSISALLTDRMIDELSASPMALQYKALVSKGWRFYVVDQSRGRCYFFAQVITYPTWIYKKPLDFKNWYYSHEMAHAVAGHKAKHGPLFQAALKAICPAISQCYEVSYKSRAMVSAGLSLDGLLGDM